MASVRQKIAFALIIKQDAQERRKSTYFVNTGKERIYGNNS